jgi:hypothetical protein
LLWPEWSDRWACSLCMLTNLRLLGCPSADGSRMLPDADGVCGHSADCTTPHSAVDGCCWRLSRP